MNLRRRSPGPPTATPASNGAWLKTRDLLHEHGADRSVAVELGDAIGLSNLGIEPQVANDGVAQPAHTFDLARYDWAAAAAQPRAGRAARRRPQLGPRVVMRGGEQSTG